MPTTSEPTQMTVDLGEAATCVFAGRRYWREVMRKKIPGVDPWSCHAAAHTKRYAVEPLAKFDTGWGGTLYVFLNDAPLKGAVS